MTEGKIGFRLERDLPLLEPLDDLLDRGSLLCSLDSPGEYGSDLSSADSGGDVHYIVLYILRSCYFLVSKVSVRESSVSLALIPMHPSTLSATLITYHIDRYTPFIPSTQHR
jgi:hypothetical protein